MVGVEDMVEVEERVIAGEEVGAKTGVAGFNHSNQHPYTCNNLLQGLGE